MKPKLLIATMGLPRSGKTTWALEQGFPIVCPDAIRFALHGERYLTKAEPAIWLIARQMTDALFLAGHNVIIFDATNTTRKRRDTLVNWGKDLYDVEFNDVNIASWVCINRAEDENDEYIIPIIKRMESEFEPLGDDEKEYSG